MLTKKEKKVAPNVEKTTKKPKIETAEVSSEVVSTEQTEEVPTKPVLFDLSDFSQEKIEQAEALGIPIRQLANRMNTYAQSVEDRFQILASAIPTKEDLQGAMAQAIVDAQQKQREQYAQGVKDGKIPVGGGQGGGMMQMFQQLAPFLGGSGGGSGEFDKMLREMGMENMLLGREVIRQTFTRGAKEILDRVDTKMAEYRAKKGS